MTNYVRKRYTELLRLVNVAVKPSRDAAARRRLPAEGQQRLRETIEEVCATARPVFVLSTGRAGTTLLTQILERYEGLEVAHSPRPSLAQLSARIDDTTTAPELHAAALHARYELVRDAYILGRRFVETNNRITPYAPALAQIFPQARLLHIVRHPQDFVRSGLSRGYYSDDGPAKLPVPAESRDWSQAQKIAWLWTQRNAAASVLGSEIGSGRYLRIQAESMFQGKEDFLQVFEFLGVDAPPGKQLARSVELRPNSTRQSDRTMIRSAQLVNELGPAADLALSYGYSIDGTRGE